MVPCSTHAEGFASDVGGLLVAVCAVWHAACDAQGGVHLTHDMYLKICQVDPERRAKVIGNAELVLLDEAHDCTEAQIALVAAPARMWGLVLVYDYSQRIYGWRRAASESYVRAMAAVSVQRLSLTWR